MKEKNKVRIAEIHICSFEKTDGKGFKFNTMKYPERLCVIDENKGIAIDVETEHQYQYVGVTSTLHFVNEMHINKIKEGQRVACFEYYMILPSSNISLEQLNKCRDIINLLERGVIFKDGNQELSNEEYLNMINQPKKEGKIRKFCKKGK